MVDPMHELCCGEPVDGVDRIAATPQSPLVQTLVLELATY